MKKLLYLVIVSVIQFGCSSNQVIQPVLKEKIEPVYPYEARVKGLEGIVEILLVVNEDGDVLNSKVIKSSNHKILDDASIDFSKRLKFEPYSLEGRSTPVYIKWKLDYKLDGIDVENGKINILVFSKTEGYRHESIDPGKDALRKIATENNFHINFSENSSVFNEGLSNYNVIIFLNTFGNILNENEQEAFKKFIRQGGGFAGIHSAILTEQDWDWYKKLIGTNSSNSEIIKKGIVRITDNNHPSTANLPFSWEITDEWNIFSVNLSEDFKILAVVQTKDLHNSQMTTIPFSWYQESEGGRFWYTSAGHNADNFSNPVFLKHILGGIKYTAGVE